MKILTIFSQFFPPKSHFRVDDVPDLAGKVVIVTGANSGVGKETAKILLARNAKVYFATRSREKTEAVIKDLKEQTGKEGIWLKLDLSNLEAVKTAAEEFLSKENELHILFNNGGVYAPPIDQLTAQGYDLQIGTNLLGHFYFTKLLLPALLAGVKSSSDGKVRVVNISSLACYFSSSFDINIIRDSERRRKCSLTYLYSQSKIGNLLFSNELAKRYGDQGIISSAVHPGSLQSELYRHVSFIERFVLRLMLYPIQYGAITPLWTGTSPEGLEFNGKFLIPWARECTDLPSALNEDVAEDLWNWCEDQVANI